MYAAPSEVSRVSDTVEKNPEMLASWREATRAATLARELAAQAVETAVRADLDATAAEEVAALARKASDAALITRLQRAASARR